ncbi:cell shape-determining protein MreB [Spirosoma sp. HMF4905]|uniref:Cell shape-determining protein MreB n=1 Tax=Spirosoma arboris TaxID=2682092 RepID=A0A7K1S5Z6_9BACT|nr:cell shape-determining protein MreB [Spirosoma arboris]
MSCILAGSLFVTSCKKTEDPAPVTPSLAITSFSPTSGKAGDVVTITGTGFNASTTGQTVSFGTTAATVLAATATNLVVQVPNSINGNFPIVVSQPGSTSVSSSTQFNVTTTISKPVVSISTAITANQNWTADNIYLLSNFVYVRSGVTVTIAPGTIIKGDKLSKGTLIFEPGSKIMAQGTADNPIIFTSNLAPGLRNLGDWGGLVITGKADDNAATGITDPTALPVVEGGPTTQVSAIDGQRSNTDNSGVLSYVRIEWAGVALSPNNEINGLSLYAVGSGTKIDHVQVSFANDDSFESFGGVQNMSYLIAYRGIDDDFDTDNGYSGNVQFGLSVRDLTIADQSGSKAFESDNDANNSTKLPQTSVVFSNMTLIGPSAVTTGGASMSTTANPANAAASANYVSAMHVRRNSALSVFNSIELGWPAGLLLDGTNVGTNVGTGKSVIANNIFGGNLAGSVNGVAGYNRDVLYISGSGGAGSLTPINALGPDSSAFGAAVGPVTYLKANNNRRLAGTAAFMLTNPFTASGTKPDVTPATGSPALTGADFTNAKLANAFFDKTPTFVGAVSADKNYTSEKWVNFDPQNAVYQ